MRLDRPETLIPAHGGYRKLKKGFQLAQAEAFEREGGFTGRLYRVRSARRGNS
jgi:mRNA degradation ribonuclease J1/J2